MTQEPELEEGETCYYNDDTSFDPDIALSYIGDKVQSILGHLQKDFEGGVTAENLGAKFGGYGSFLPTHQRSPSIWSLPKSPQGVQNHHSSRSPSLFPEDPAPNSVTVRCAPSAQKNGYSSSPSMHKSQTSKTSVDGSSIRQKPTLSTDNVAEKIELPSSKPANPPDHRTLKVRLKVGPERVAQYNAEIYNLGLTSPSSSEGYSHDESDELQFESYQCPNESPGNILKIMTSVPVSGGLLLSPLCEDLINLVQERGCVVEREHVTAPRSTAISVKILNNNGFGGSKTKIVNKIRELDKSEDEFTADLSDCKPKSLDIKNLECSARPLNDSNLRPLSDTVRESENDFQVIKRKGSKDKVKGRAVSGDSIKDASFERTSDQSYVEKIVKNQANPTKDVSVDHGQGSRSQDKRTFLKAYSDKSESEGVNRSMDTSSLKAGLNSTSSEQNGCVTPRTIKGLPLEGEKKSKGNQSRGHLVSKTGSGKKDSGKIRLSQKDVVRTNLEERSSVDMAKNFSLDTVKVKSVPSNKLKERSSNENYFDKVPSETHIVEPQDSSVHFKEGDVNVLEQTVAAPVVIEEDWVQCDCCQKWRVLPYGTKPGQLPDKWVCSMLDWLPGMNSCDISENDTTNALHASYLVPVPDNQHHYQGHVDGTLSGVTSATAHHFDQNHQDFGSDQMKKKKLKGKQDIISMSDPVRGIGKKQLAVKNGISKEGKLSLAGVNATNNSDLQTANKSSIVLAKSNKRKGEHVIGDDANLRKRIKKESDVHDVHGNARIKSKDALIIDNYQTSGLSNKAAVKDAKKKSGQKEVISGGAVGNNLKITVKKHKDQMQGLPDNKPLGTKTCNGGEVAVKKIKLKDYGYSQNQADTQQNNGSHLQDRKVSVKEESKDGDFHIDKKSRVSRIEEYEFKSNPGGEARVRSSKDKEYPVNRVAEKEQKLKKPRAKMQLTIEDIDKLRKDLGCEQLSTAATSSSSKVSDSRKNRISYTKVKGSPEESVSSSPVRNQVDSRFNSAPAIVSVKKSWLKNESSQLGISRKRTSGVTNDNSESELLDPKKKLKGEIDAEGNNCVPKHEVSSNIRHPFSDESSLKSVKNGKSVGSRDLGKTGNGRCENQKLPKSSEQISAEIEPWSGKYRIDPKQGALCPEKHASGSLKRGPSVVGVTSKALKDTAINSLQNETENFIKKEAEQSVPLESNLVNKNVVSVVNASSNLKEAEDVLKEAEELRSHADLIKNSGFSSESNYEYFKAALKFLHCASLLEACDGVSSKQLEMSPMQMYGAAAQLCKTCAHEYEKSHELAAASLAYKCVEVAYLRVVYCKSSTATRLCHDLQSSLQMVPQGESPSSSASDVDNLNNLAIVDKATLSKGSGPHAGNHVIGPRNRPNFVRLLDFTKDVNYAMEAAKKSQDTFAAAHQELEKSCNKEAIISVKKVIDFSFQNVEELLRLVWLAFNTINHQGLSGSKG